MLHEWMEPHKKMVNYDTVIAVASLLVVHLHNRRQLIEVISVFKEFLFVRKFYLHTTKSLQIPRKILFKFQLELFRKLKKCVK
jgi:hypothetical protein